MGRLVGLVAFAWAAWNIGHTMTSGISGNRSYVEGRLIGLAIAVVIVLVVGVRFIALCVGARSLTKDAGPSY